MIEIQIRQAYLKARKSKDKDTLDTLSLIISSIDDGLKRGLTIDDGYVRTIIKKSLESLNILLEAKKSINRDISQEEKAIKLLNTFLPTEMTEEEILAFINEVVGEQRGPRFISAVMNEAKERGLVFVDKLLAKLVRG